jgi:hypothetical protein
MSKMRRARLSGTGTVLSHLPPQTHSELSSKRGSRSKSARSGAKELPHHSSALCAVTRMVDLALWPKVCGHCMPRLASDASFSRLRRAAGGSAVSSLISSYVHIRCFRAKANRDPRIPLPIVATRFGTGGQ